GFFHAGTLVWHASRDTERNAHPRRDALREPLAQCGPWRARLHARARHRAYRGRSRCRPHPGGSARRIHPSLKRGATTMALDFYHGHGSPFSWRVWLALEHLGVPYNLKILSFQYNDTTKPEFVAINPRHQVPTIVAEGFALWESTVILEYLHDRFGGGKRLYPGDLKRRAK